MRRMLLYAALILLGVAYYRSYNILPESHISNFISGDTGAVAVRGVIADDPVTDRAVFGGKKTSFTLKSNLLTEDGRSFTVSGPVKVNIYSDEDLKEVSFGDEIEARGTLSRPKGLKNRGLFDYAAYMKIKNIYAVFNVSGAGSVKLVRGAAAPYWQLAAYDLRNKIERAIDSRIDGRYSAFLNAILVGKRNELDSAVLDDFIRTGTVHVIAISGLNIVLIAALFMMIFKLFGIKKKAGLVMTSALLIFYCFVAGSNPPVVRAVIMFVIASIGYLINRESDLLTSLAAAAFLIFLWNPNELFDPSFQLSFVSIAGIVLFSPRIEEWVKFKPEYLAKSVALSLAAIISVGPIVAKYFNIFSPVAVIANIVIVPALFVITVISAVYLLLAFLVPGALALLAAKALSLSVQLTFYLNHLFGSLPFSHIRLPAPSLAVLALYYMFVFLFFFSPRKKETLVALLVLLNIFVWSKSLSASGDKLKVTFLDVGKGDSILLELPGRKTMLIDGGSGGEEGLMDMGRAVVAPYLWNKGINRLDAVVSTHFHDDHAGGVPYILKNFDIGCAMDSGVSGGASTRLYDNYRKIILQKKIRRLAIYDGDEITGFPGVRLFVMNPPEGHSSSDVNEASTVIKLEYRDFSALFCADASGKGVENMLKYGSSLRSRLLKIPHHGGSAGKESNVKIFFERVAPEVAIISSGAGFRSKESLRGDIYSKTTVYDTKNNGAIEAFTDGKGYTIKPLCPKN